MRGLEADTIGGFNSMIEKQKKEEGEAFVSVVLFDDYSEVVYDRVEIRKVEPMTEKQYYVRGCTALLDALGGAIRHIRNIHKYVREEDVPEKTLFIITTDGMENASRSFTYDAVREMITRQKEEAHWEFLFLGANIDAVKEAGRFGIHPTRAVNFKNDAAGTKLNYRVMSDVVSCARGAASAQKMQEMFEEEEMLAPIREDYRQRSDDKKAGRETAEQKENRRKTWFRR